jgi:hypothetical protein
MLESILVGSLLTMVTVAVHASGTAWWIQVLKVRGEKSKGQAGDLREPMVLLCSTALVLVLLHIVEVGIWAITYRILPGLTPLDSWEEAVYFSTVTFASLGYGDIVIQGSWRLLSAIQAMNGLLLFGWSTALLFSVVQRIWKNS